MTFQERKDKRIKYHELVCKKKEKEGKVFKISYFNPKPDEGLLMITSFDFLKEYCTMSFKIKGETITIESVNCETKGYCTLLFTYLYSKIIYDLGIVDNLSVEIKMDSRNIEACYCYLVSAKNMGFSVVINPIDYSITGSSGGRTYDNCEDFITSIEEKFQIRNIQDDLLGPLRSGSHGEQVQSAVAEELAYKGLFIISEDKKKEINIIGIEIEFLVLLVQGINKNIVKLSTG